MSRICILWTYLVVFLLIGNMTIEVRGQVVDADLSDSDLVSAFESRGDSVVKIALYKKTGDEFKLAAIVEMKGIITFNSNGIVSGLDSFIRLQLAEAKDKWLSITKRELIDGRAIITTDDGKTYTIFNLGIGPFAGEIESGVVSKTK